LLPLPCLLVPHSSNGQTLPCSGYLTSRLPSQCSELLSIDFGQY
jgi:hypothetical protein